MRASSNRHYRLMRRACMSAVVVSVLIGTAIRAHHAPSIYDTEAEKVITGTVTAFDWVQPHTWTTVTTTDAHGTAVVWALEGMNPLILGRRGWNRHTLKPGDRIEIAFYPRRDGTHKGMFIRARLADGSLKVMAVSPGPAVD